MPSLDEIKCNRNLIGNGKWPTKSVKNETVKEPTAEDTTDANSLPCYRMKSEPQGIAVIISNKIFKNKGTRIGTDIDALALERLFTYLGFYTNRYNNLTGSEIVRTLKEVASIDYKSYDCLMVAILTHGEEGKLYGSDDKLVSVQDLITLFNGNQCPLLAGKPKIFFLQACRGGSYDKGVKHDMVDGGGEISNEEHYDYIRMKLIEDELDEADSGYKGLSNTHTYLHTYITNYYSKLLYLQFKSISTCICMVYA